MRDYNQIVGDLRAFLQSVDRTADPRMAALASEYARLCTDANERLNRCGAFLRQGLRSEAIHLAQTEPDLLDMLAVLEFPERNEWDEIASMYNWPKAPALAIATAEAVNEAYALEAPLEDLLFVHRRLALARAPLTARMETMRKIAALDADNPIWAEDLGQFERVRQDQIAKEAQVARGFLDAAVLRELTHEIETTGWLVSPSDPLVESVREAAVFVTQEDTRRELRSILTSFHQARAANDPHLGRQLRSRWLALIDAAAIPAHDPLHGQAQGVMDWLEKADRKQERANAYHEVLQDLEQAIAERAERRVLQALEQEALGYGRGLPDALQSALQQRYRDLGRSERRNNRVALGAVAAVVLLLAATLAWSAARGKRTTALQKAAATIESLVGAGKLKEASAALETVERDYPGASGDDEMGAALDKLRTAQQKEDDRVKRFLAAVKEVEEAPLGDRKAAAIEAARGLARSPTEEAQVNRLDAARRALVEQEQGKADRALRPAFERFQDQLARAEMLAKGAATPQEAREVFGALRALVPRLRELAPAASDESSRQVLAAIARLDRLESNWSARSERERALASLVEAATAIHHPDALKDYVKAYERHLEKFPKDERTESLRKTFDERYLWEWAMSWGTMLRGWPAAVTSLTPKQAGDRAERIKLFLVNYPDTAAPPELEAHRRFAESVARLDDPGFENPARDLRRLLENPVIDGVWRLKTRNGKVYYARKKPLEAQAGYQVDTLVDVNGNEQPRFVNQANFDSLELSPQSQLAARIKAGLARWGDSAADWESGALQALQIVRDDQDIDPILKVAFLKGIMRAASRGDTLLEAALEVPMRRFQNEAIDLNVAWMDPDDEKADFVRDRARPLVAGFPLIASIRKEVEENARRLGSEHRQVYWPVGLVWRDAEGTWRCQVSARTPANTPLYVPVPGGSWKKVGDRKGTGERVAVDQAAPDLQEGRLVFVRRAEI